MNEVIVVARAVARPGDRDRVARLLRDVIAPTRAETGALAYWIGQSADNPDVFTAVERWRSESDLEQHLAAPHIRHLSAQLPGLLAVPLVLHVHRELEVSP